MSRSLNKLGIIANSRWFFWYGRLTGKWKKVKVGEYRLSPSMSPIEIFNTLTSGISIGHPITIREGENLYEIAEDLAAKSLCSKEAFIELSKDPIFIASLGYFKESLPISLEGYYFPETYLFNRTSTAPEIAKQMVKHFFEHWGPVQEAAAESLQMTRHQVVTLASMIEKETGAPEERPMISSVFHNRLKKHMKLQSDPTTIYGMWDRYRGKIHKKDLFEKNLYNTYSVDALPLGPIANPGKEALEAALHPSETPYFYFVSHNNGTHQFSVTFNEHLSAVKTYQLDPKAREGKSWRDLKKRSHQDSAHQQKMKQK